MSSQGLDDVGVLVFAYGSLMKTDSLMGSLDRTPLWRPQTIELAGWRRAWNCVSAKTFVPASRGHRVRRVVLGLRPVRTGSCRGVLLRIAESDLPRLRKREAAYDEFDVTDSIDRPQGRVLTFVPKQARTRGRVVVPEPLVVERSYLDRCVSGAAEHGLTAVRAELESTAGLEVVDEPTEVRFSWPPR